MYRLSSPSNSSFVASPKSPILSSILSVKNKFPSFRSLHLYKEKNFKTYESHDSNANISRHRLSKEYSIKLQVLLIFFFFLSIHLKS